MKTADVKDAATLLLIVAVAYVAYKLVVKPAEAFSNSLNTTSNVLSGLAPSGITDLSNLFTSGIGAQAAKAAGSTSLVSIITSPSVQQAVTSATSTSGLAYITKLITQNKGVLPLEFG